MTLEPALFEKYAALAPAMRHDGVCASVLTGATHCAHRILVKSTGSHRFYLLLVQYFLCLLAGKEQIGLYSSYSAAGCFLAWRHLSSRAHVVEVHHRRCDEYSE